MFKKIVFITESFFSKNDYERFGIKYFKSQNIKFEVINACPITRSKYYNDGKKKITNSYNFEKICINKSDFEKNIREIKSDTFIMLHVDSNKFVLEQLNKHKVPYVKFMWGSQPAYNKSIKDIIKYSILFPINFVFQIITKIEIYITNKSKKPVMIFCSGSDYYNSLKKLYKKKTKIIKMPSLEYDKFILNKINNKPSIKQKKKGYAVYIDVPYRHSDQDNSKKRFPPETPCSYKNYYDPLNNFFKQFIKITSLRLKISVHPRGGYKKNPYKYGKLYFGKTNKLVAKANVILVHSSLAHNYAILYKKPVIFLTQKNFTYSNKQNVFNLACFFKKSPLDIIEDKFDIKRFKEELKIDKQLYISYKNRFIAEKNFNFPSYKIIYESLKKYAKNE